SLDVAQSLEAIFDSSRWSVSAKASEAAGVSLLLMPSTIAKNGRTRAHAATPSLRSTCCANARGPKAARTITTASARSARITRSTLEYPAMSSDLNHNEALLRIVETSLESRAVLASSTNLC